MRPTIDDVIADGAVRTLFQPVVHLASGAVVGFEALSRGPAGTALESPIALLEAARAAGRLGELDWLCRALAMKAALHAVLPEEISWLINVEPAGLAMSCPTHLLPELTRARSELRVVLEVVERDVSGNVLDLIRATDRARRDSWGVALDDVGAEEASLALLPFLQPDVVKLDMSLVRSVPSADAAAITAAVRSYAERRGAVILAEGIETEEHEQLALVFGATYGQGYRYGRPGPLPRVLPAPPPGIAIPLSQRLQPLDGRTPFEVLAAHTQPQRGLPAHLNHIGTHLENQADGDHIASVLLADFHDASFFTAERRARYAELARHNALTVVVADGLAGWDEPSFHCGPPRADSRSRDEWVLIVLNPHFTAAFAVREHDREPGRPQEYDFVYTHDSETVIAAARCFMQDVDRDGTSGERRETSESAEPAEPAVAVPRPRAPARSEAVAAAALRTDPKDPADPAFQAASRMVLAFLRDHMPLGFWSITRVANGRQTYLLLDDAEYGLTVGASHPWQDSLCVHMVAGTAPRVAPDVDRVPAYAAAAVRDTLQIGAYAGAPIREPDGRLFGAICGFDPGARVELAGFEAVLTLLSELLTLALAADRALDSVQWQATQALTLATTDARTGVHNRRGWDGSVAAIERATRVYGDPTLVLSIVARPADSFAPGGAAARSPDLTLRAAATVLRHNLRDVDALARLGDHELGVILRHTPDANARLVVFGLERALRRAGVDAVVGWATVEAGGSVEAAMAKAAIRRDRPMASATG